MPSVDYYYGKTNMTRQELVDQFVEEFHDSHILNAEQNVPMEYKRVENYLKVQLHKLLKEAAIQINLNLEKKC